jgi:hypothetical protein
MVAHIFGLKASQSKVSAGPYLKNKLRNRNKNLLVAWLNGIVLA